MANQIIRVVAAVIQHKGQFLIGQRPDHKRHGGLWEFPGGKLLADESLFDATRRELKEELGVEVVKIGDILYSSQDKGSPFLIEFVETQITGEPTPLEHSDLKWGSQADLGKMRLAPTDARFVSEYLSQQ